MNGPLPPNLPQAVMLTSTLHPHIPLQSFGHGFCTNVGSDNDVIPFGSGIRFGLVDTESMGLKKTELANSGRPSSHSHHGTFAA